MTLAAAPTLDAIRKPVEADLKRFQSVLEKELASDDVLIRGIHDHLLGMAGKFLRPIVTLLSANIQGKHPEEACRLAAAIELIHTATLVHDDVIDASFFRRNQPSIYSKWGPEISIVSGDYLYAKAFLLVAGLKDVRINEALARCAHIMCEGEMKQIEKRSDFRVSEAEYLKIIHKKTAALFQAAAIGGGFFSGASPRAIEQLGKYGYALGMAFQIVDDCLDLTGETQILGKTSGLDLAQNEVTLPMLYLFEAIDAAEAEELRRALKINESDLQTRIRRRAVETGAVSRAMEKARAYAAAAAEALSDLPASDAKSALLLLGAHCIDRLR